MAPRLSMLSRLRFENEFQRRLPADPDPSPRRRQVLGAAYSRVRPTPVAAPYLIAYAAEAARLIDLEAAECESQLFVDVFSGNRVLVGMDPYAACYGGHQFGNWAGQLGDGRAITLGDVRAADGGRWELQLKGAGPTPYSRSADGRAVVRSSVREFLCSEAMYHLGVPTTRAASLIGTGELVVRDMFYDGRPRPEPGAVVCRMAPSFVRFGSFEIFAARRDLATLEALGRYVVEHHYPELGAPSPRVYAAFFAEVCRRTAILVAHWMRVGFVHGVMNTDNMSVLGLTVDYGPYGWLESFEPDWTPNTTDAAGRRYRYRHQPLVALWNLARFAEALHPLVSDVDALQAGLELYRETLASELSKLMLAKIGLLRASSEAAERDPDAADEAALGVPLGDSLVDDLFRVLQIAETDMTLFFRRLADVPAAPPTPLSDRELVAPLLDAYYSPEQLGPGELTAIAGWLRRYQRRLVQDDIPDAVRKPRMHAVNPKFVFRNYLAQLVIDDVENGRFESLAELHEVLRRPYDEQPGRERYAEKRPEWARHRPGCSMLSCSS